MSTAGLTLVAGYTDLGRGFQDALQAAGLSVIWIDGQPYSPNAAAVQTLAAGYDPLPSAKTDRQTEVDEALVAKVAAPWTYNGIAYQIDPESQVNITAQGALAASVLSNTPGANPWPTGFYWVAADNSQQPMTAAQMYAFAQAASAYVSALILYARALKDQIGGATTLAAIAAIDITTGWPT